MDNPALSLLHQEDFSELLASYGAAGQAIACRWSFTESIRKPTEEMIRGSRIIGLNSRALRNLAGIGNIVSFTTTCRADERVCRTALGRWLAQLATGLVVAPSLLFEELEVRGRAEKPSDCRSCTAPMSATK